MIRKLLIFLILIGFILPVLLGGCWDLRPMKERGIVVGVGIDRVEGTAPIQVSLQVIDLDALKSGGGGVGSTERGGASSRNTVVVETSRGRTFYEAVRNILAYSSRQITFAHNRIVILGNDLAKSDITGVMDDMGRDFQYRLTNWMFVAEKTAKEVLESRTDIGLIPAVDIGKMMLNRTIDTFILPINRNDFLYQLTGEGKSGFIPLIQVEPPGINPAPRIRIDKTAIFSDNRLAYILTPHESKGLVWLFRGKKSGTVVFPYTPGNDPEPKMISVEVRDVKTKITPHRFGGQLTMEIMCTGRGVLRESEGIRNNPRTFAELERKTASALTGSLILTIRKAQQLKIDFLGFGRIIHQEKPELWHRFRQNWEEEFVRIRPKVRFQITLEQFGSIKDSTINQTERNK